MHCRTKPLLPSLCLIALLASAAPAQTPTPRPHLPFTLPMTDGTTAAAIILPTQAGQAYLVYATTTGRIGSYLMTPGTTPTPGPIDPPAPPIPVPDPPAPPPVPTPTRLALIGEMDKPNLSTAVTATLSAWAVAVESYSVAQVADPSTPAAALRLIGRSAGKRYPFAIALTAAGTVTWEGNLSNDPTAAIATLAAVFGRTPPASPACPDGLCPPLRRFRLVSSTALAL